MWRGKISHKPMSIFFRKVHPNWSETGVALFPIMQFKYIVYVTVSGQQSKLPQKSQRRRRPPLQQQAAASTSNPSATLLLVLLPEETICI